MISYLFSNQRAIRVVKAPVGASNPYSMFNIEAARAALLNLSPNAFKLWFYMNMNQNGYEFGLSSVETRAYCGFSKNTYTKCFKELVDKGYLEAVELYPDLDGFIFKESLKNWEDFQEK